MTDQEKLRMLRETIQYVLDSGVYIGMVNESAMDDALAETAELEAKLVTPVCTRADRSEHVNHRRAV